MKPMWLRRRYETVPAATKLTAAGLVVACSVSLGSALVARADSVSDQKRRNDQRIADLGQQLEGTNAKLAGAYVNLQRTNAALPVAQQRVSSALAAQARAVTAQQVAEATEQRAIAAEAAARAHNEQVAQKLAVARANESRATEQLTKSSTQLTTSQDALDAYAAEVFQGSDQQSQLGLVFGATSPQDFADKLVMADTASSVASDTIDALAAMTADNTSTQAYLTSVRGEIADLKRQAEAALRKAESASAAATQARNQAVVAKNNAVTAAQNAAAAKASLDSLKQKQVAYAADLKEQKANEAADLAAARAESARLQAILVERARQAKIREAKRLAKLRAERAAKIRAERAKAAAARKRGQHYVPRVPPPVSSGDSTPSNYLSYPANGPTTSGFGMRWHPVLHKWMLHDGLDWGIACGTPVYAAAPGDIIRAGWRASGWGNQVVIDHGIHRGVDLVTTYNHLTSIVKFGGSVRRGQLIGYSGTTGYSTGCHLHFGVYEDGTPVNPRGWL